MALLTADEKDHFEKTMFENSKNPIGAKSVSILTVLFKTFIYP